MTEQHPNAPKSRSSTKPRKTPYIPSNPSRRKSIGVTTCAAGITDPYSPNKQPTIKTKSDKLLIRIRSVPPRESTTNNNNTSLDDIAPSSGSRPSRWESCSAEASVKSTGMAMPTRRRGLSPSPDSDTLDVPPTMSKRSPLPASRSSEELKHLRRKFSGTDIHHPPSSSSSNNHHTTTLQSAMHARRTRLMKPRRHTSPARKRVPTLASSSSRPSSSLSDLSPIDIQSDDDDDHVFVRRTNSTKALFFQRDDSPARTRTWQEHKTKDHFRRRSDVGRLRIPAVFANDASNEHKKRDPATVLSKLDLGHDDDLGGEDLNELVRALDNESEDDAGHIFCSSSDLLDFADDESDDED